MLTSCYTVNVMKLIRFELSKIAVSRGFCGMVAVLFAISFLVGYLSSEEPGYDLQAVETIMEAHKQNPEESLREYEALKQEYELYVQLLLSEDHFSATPPASAVRFEQYQIAFERLNRQQQYSEALQGAILNLKKQSNSVEGEQEIINRYLLSVYGRNLSLRLGEGSTDCLPELYRMIASLYLPLMLFGILLGISSVYSQRERGTESLIRAAWKGRSLSALAKAAACTLICGTSILLSLFFAVGAYSLKSGFFCFGEYIQTCSDYMLFPIPLTVAESLLILFALIFASCLLFCGIACCFSKYCGNRIFPLVFTSLLLLAGILPSPPEAGDLLHILPPSRLFDGTKTFAHLYPVVMGETTLYGGFAVGAGYLICLLLVWGGFILLPGNALEQSRLQLSLPKLTRRNSVCSVMGYEWKKQIFAGKTILLLAFAIALKVMVSWNGYTYEPTYTDEKYRSYMTSIQGPYTDEKQEKLEEDLNEIYELLGNRSLMEKRYRSGEISREEMGRYLSAYYEAEHNEKALLAVKDRLDVLRARRDAGEAAFVVYETGWEKLLSLNTDLILLILMIGACCGLYSDEYKRGMHRLYAVCSPYTPMKAKLFFCLCFAIGASLLFRGIDLAVLLKASFLPCPEAPACGLGALPFLGNAPLWVTFAATVLLCFGFSFFVALVSFALSRLTKNKGVAFLLSLGLLLPISIFFFGGLL